MCGGRISKYFSPNLSPFHIFSFWILNLKKLSPFSEHRSTFPNVEKFQLVKEFNPIFEYIAHNFYHRIFSWCFYPHFSNYQDLNQTENFFWWLQNLSPFSCYSKKIASRKNSDLLLFKYIHCWLFLSVLQVSLSCFFVRQTLNCFEMFLHIINRRCWRCYLLD